MIRQAVDRMLNAPWRLRVAVDATAVGLAAIVLPKVAERVTLTTWPGFALTMVISAAILLAAAWAVVPPGPVATRRP